MEFIQFLQSFSSDFLNWLMIVITSFGSLYFIMFVVAVIYWCYNKEIGYKIAIITAFSCVVNGIVKNLVQAIRPYANDNIIPIGKFTASGYSFPSGHVQNITTFSASMYIFTRNKVLFFLTFIITALVSFSRVYLGLHWITDIVGGIVLALFISIFLNELLAKLDKFKATLFMSIMLCIFIIMGFFISKDEFGKDYFISLGLFAGIYLGHFFEERYVDFSVYSSNLDNIMKVIIGIGSTLLIEFLFFTFLTGNVYFFIIRYFIIGFWIIGGVPFIFKLSRLYYKDAYEITNTRYTK